MGKYSRSISLLAVLISLLMFAVRGVSAPNRIQVFGADRLANASTWWGSDATFYPSTPGHNATVVFPANKWSAFIGDLPLKRLDGAFTTHLRYRWITDLNTIKGATATVQFGDRDGHDLPGSNTPLVVSAGWQELTVTAKIPKDAIKVRYDIDCGAGAGTLEIADYDLSLDGANLTDAAINGAVMPWLNVPGGKAALPEAGPNSAIANFTTADPYSFDSPVWTTPPQYPIPTTTANKSPLNAVAANFQVAWTPENLYVRYHAHDPILNFKAKSRYARDCFEFFLMPTGNLGKASAQVSKEQYTISRTPEGQTDANADAITRLVSDGWEAIVKIPLQSEARRLYPFNGLTMTFNAVYQDCNTLPQEHWLSFSKKDQTDDSWRDTRLYVPLVFTTEEKVAFKPFWLGDTDSTAYNVVPKFPGRINLVHSAATLANIDLWDLTPEAKLDASAEGGHNIFRIQYIRSPRQRRVAFAMSPFNVLAGETLDITLDARVVAGSGTGAPGLAFLSESCWNTTGSSHVAGGDLTPQWTKQGYTMTMPDSARGNLRNGRLLFDFGVRPGTTVEIRDIKVTRRAPADFDALITVPSHYSHYWDGQKNSVDFQFASGIATQAKITAQVVNYFTGKTVLSHQWTKDMPLGASSASWDISALPNGFFNVLLKVRDAKGGFLADRELYVSKSIKNTRLSSFSGLFVTNKDVSAPASIPDTIAQLKGLGEGRGQWSDLYLYDSNGNDLPGDQLGLLRAYHHAGMETGFTVPQGGTHSIGRNWQPDELQSFYDRFLTTTQGLFTHLSFSNESNLYGGWFPEPDAREWAIYNRGFYNAVKRDAPGTRPILGSFNDLAVDYVKMAASENQNSFADGVMGFHLYGIDVNGSAFKEILDARRALDQIHPGWEAWDTESGLVFYTFENALDLQSKKMPILLCGGYTSSIYLDGYGYTFPCGDSTPLVPMEAFKNHFYLDCTPVGRVTSPDGKVNVYLFRHSDGQGLASFWNTSQDKTTFELPVHGRGRLIDLFGNPLRALKDGKNSIPLGDRFVRYAQGVDLSVLVKDPTFIPAFKSAKAKPTTDPSTTTSVFLTPVGSSKAFDREIPKGQPSEIALSLHNDSPFARKLKLESDAPEGLQVSFGNSGPVLLKPQETRVVMAKIQASKDLDSQSFSVLGTLDNGMKVMPIVFTVKTTPAVSVRGYSRAVEMTNNSRTSADVSVVATKPEFVFQPGIVKATLDHSASQSVPMQILPNGNYNGNFNTLNVPVYYSMSVSSPQTTYTKDGLCTVFSPDAQDNGAADFTSLPYTANPARTGSEPFQVDYKLNWTSDGLRVIARVQDASPVQSGQNGSLRDGGDCMVLAFDPSDDPNPSTFGAKYEEFGFAYSHDAPTSYHWDGHYGLESSTPFPDAINKISRDANYIYYDVTIPQKRIFPQNGGNAGMSIVFVDKAAQGASQIIELGQGVLPQRDPAKMGVLLRKK